MEPQIPKNNPASQDAGPSCVICFDHISLTTKAIIKNCGHEFCFVCIKSWMDTTTTCPLCKQNFDTLQHSFTSDGTYQEEKIEPPNIKKGGGPGDSNIEDQLQCLDHSFFIGNVQSLLEDAERVHLRLWHESQSHRGLSAWEKQRLETVEGVLAELRNHKRKLQSYLSFDPYTTLQDLYRLQDLLRSAYGAPPAVSSATSRSRSPVRYSADDADAVADLSDEDDLVEEMVYFNLSKNKKAVQAPARGNGRQRKSKVRTPQDKVGSSRNRKGIAN